ncbi:hypothetical protein VTN00DRAFT_4265 [Thermoascus crustaceus]|uniref:uncharacterized protein n=1 Tax=Thermoascus crustaceus TaxID=5088 RepID=UPI0037440494
MRDLDTFTAIPNSEWFLLIDPCLFQDFPAFISSFRSRLMLFYSLSLPSIFFMMCTYLFPHTRDMHRHTLFPHHANSRSRPAVYRCAVSKRSLFEPNGHLHSFLDYGLRRS